MKEINGEINEEKCKKILENKEKIKEYNKKISELSKSSDDPSIKEKINNLENEISLAQEQNQQEQNNIELPWQPELVFGSIAETIDDYGLILGSGDPKRIESLIGTLQRKSRVLESYARDLEDASLFYADLNDCEKALETANNRLLEIGKKDMPQSANNIESSPKAK